MAALSSAYQHQGSLLDLSGPTTPSGVVVLPAGDPMHQQQERLLKGPHNLQLNQVPTAESRALYTACGEGAGLAAVERLLAAGANANWYNNTKGGETALHAASRRTGPLAARVVGALIAAGAQPGVISLPEFNTPLHLAAAAGNLETVKLLVEWHLKASASDATLTAAAAALLVLWQGNAYGNSPLHEASINGHDAVVGYLLELDNQLQSEATQVETPRQVDMQNKRGSTPLLFALYGQYAPAPLVERLLARGADPAHTDHDGVGVLHVCASQGHEHLLPLFLGRFRAAGVDVVAREATRRDANGHDPAFYARMKGNAGIVRLLREAAAAGGK